MTLLETPMSRLDGTPTTLAELADGQVSLVVNVASRCGLTPQYGALEEIHKRYAAQGFTVIGLPCNQFMGQEPGTSAEIADFCSTTYGLTFPMSDKLNVNEPERHAVYDVLTETEDAEGVAGDVQWNFEKFLVDRDGTVVDRFRPKVTPDDPRILDAIEALLN